MYFLVEDAGQQWPLEYSTEQTVLMLSLIYMKSREASKACEPDGHEALPDIL